MTVIIKSNVVSTRNMGNIFGIQDTDYRLLLDFNLGEYRRKDNGVATSIELSDAITVTRASEARYLDANNTLQTAIPNQPRLSYKDGVRGLLLEAGFTELLANPNTPVNQTVNLAYRAGDRYVLAVKGTGSAVLTSSGVVELDTGSEATATEGNPIIYKSLAAGNVNLVLTGSVSAVSLQLVTALNGIAPKTFAPVGVTTVAPDLCKLSDVLVSDFLTGLTDFTLVINTIERKRPSVGVFNSSNNIFSLVDTTNPKSGIYLSRSTGVSQLSKLTALTGTATTKTQSKLVSDTVYKHKYVLSCANNGADMIFARNGEADEIAGAYTLSPNSLLIGSKNDWASTGALNGLVTSIVVYDKKLSLADAQKLSIV